MQSPSAVPCRLQPQLSVIVTSRNDDHGGSMLRRMQVFVSSLFEQAQKYQLATELIIVEWNPPLDRPSLVEVLAWDKQNAWCDVRIVEVPLHVHQRFKNSEHMNLFQMIAKNVGVRRARAPFVLMTNIDIIFSDELMEFMTSGQLQVGRMYRSIRIDIEEDVPQHAPIDELMAYCRSNVLRVWRSHGQGGPQVLKLSRSEQQLVGTTHSTNPHAQRLSFRQWLSIFVLFSFSRLESFGFESESRSFLLRRMLTSLVRRPWLRLLARPSVQFLIILKQRYGMRLLHPKTLLAGLTSVLTAFPLLFMALRNLLIHGPRHLQELYHILEIGEGIKKARLLLGKTGARLKCWPGLCRKFPLLLRQWIARRSRDPGMTRLGLIQEALRIAARRGLNFGSHLLWRWPTRLAVRSLAATAWRMEKLVLHLKRQKPASALKVNTSILSICLILLSKTLRKILRIPHLVKNIKLNPLRTAKSWASSLVHYIHNLIHLAKGSHSGLPVLDFFELNDEILMRFSTTIHEEMKPLQQINTFACGDFMLLDRDSWFRLEGSCEWEIFSFHLDSITMYKAWHAGLVIEDLPLDCVHYHIEHGGGFTPERNRQMYLTWRRKGVPILRYSSLVRITWAMMQGKDIAYSRKNWGLGDIELNEKHLIVS